MDGLLRTVVFDLADDLSFFVIHTLISTFFFWNQFTCCPCRVIANCCLSVDFLGLRTGLIIFVGGVPRIFQGVSL